MLLWTANTGVNVLLAAAAALVLVLIALRLTFGQAGWSWLMTNVPLLGPVWHWTGRPRCFVA